MLAKGKVKIRRAGGYGTENIIEDHSGSAIMSQNHRGKYMSDQTTPSPQQTKRRGCFFYGCVTVLVIAVLVGIAGFFAVRYGLNKLTAFVEQYTEAVPMTLPGVQMSSTDYSQLDKRVTAFTDALNAQKAASPLLLTGDEINALIANNSGWKQLKGKLYVTIEGDEIKGQVSLPMDDLAQVPGLSRLKGRYLNGSASLKVSLQNGTLSVTMQSLQVKGQSPPANVMAQLRAQNLAQNIYNDPKGAEMIRKLESIEIKDGNITIKAKARE
ncbi:MAG: hypothetical protein DME19_03955 [Verrucomicrobia bacterium]|nr:MAG: hypothetical protein DME19_03955 [Verrucomicrobiota bacterium]